jgi:hypothetical protein
MASGPDAVHVLEFLSEHNLCGPDALLARARASVGTARVDWRLRVVREAEALAADDDAHLAAAIEDAEAHGLVPHAARMRIVLAQRTGDRAPLDIARPVLERLGDRQYLRRLEEVDAALAAKAPAAPPRSSPPTRGPTQRIPPPRAHGG